jgi:hypothetical protein
MKKGGPFEGRPLLFVPNPHRSAFRRLNRHIKSNLVMMRHERQSPATTWKYVDVIFLAASRSQNAVDYGLGFGDRVELHEAMSDQQRESVSRETIRIDERSAVRPPQVQWPPSVASPGVPPGSIRTVGQDRTHR